MLHIISYSITCYIAITIKVCIDITYNITLYHITCHITYYMSYVLHAPADLRLVVGEEGLLYATRGDVV